MVSVNNESPDLQSGAIPDKVDTVLTFLLEEDIQCVTFGLVDDIIALELDELLTFVLEVVESMPGVGIGATATTTVMIIDDDGTYTRVDPHASMLTQS